MHTRGYYKENPDGTHAHFNNNYFILQSRKQDYDMQIALWQIYTMLPTWWQAYTTFTFWCEYFVLKSTWEYQSIGIKIHYKKYLRDDILLGGNIFHAISASKSQASTGIVETSTILWSRVWIAFSLLKKSNWCTTNQSYYFFVSRNESVWITCML